MDYEKNLEFVKYFQENVLEDLKPMILKLNLERTIVEIPFSIDYEIIDNETGEVKQMVEHRIRRESHPKYDMEQSFEIFKQHINMEEYEKFCKIFRTGQISIWYSVYFWATGYREGCFIRRIELKYEQYFRDQKRHEAKLKRKIKIIKNENPLK